MKSFRRSRIIKTCITFFLLLLIWVPAGAAKNNTDNEPHNSTPIQLYVDQDAPASYHDGLSWRTAYLTLQDALDWTHLHGTTDYEIWVAEGIYYPDEGRQHASGALTETFTITWDNVKLYGGFTGNETSRTQRNWIAHPTILSGDLDGNDRNLDGNFISEIYSDTVGNNAYQILYLDGETYEPLTGNTVIDGFIITGARISDHGSYQSGGVNIAGKHLGGATSTPYLANLIISGNQGGGGLNNSGNSSPTLIHLTLQGNRSDDLGGGMYNYCHETVSCKATLIDVDFLNNRAEERGGGLYIKGINGADSSMTLLNTTFQGNSAGWYGGGIYNECSSSGTYNPRFVNVLISGNESGLGGGGMLNVNPIYGSPDSFTYPMMINATIVGNRSQVGGGMNNERSFPTLINSIVWNNAAGISPQIYISEGSITVTNSDIEGGFPGTGNLNVDPQFIAPVPPAAAPTSTGNYHLSSSSPLINVGDDSAVTDQTDLEGRPRILGSHVDLGAYEFSRYLSIVKTGTGTGTVTSNPPGIHCGSTCFYEFAPDTLVTLMAAPAVDSTFSGWQGAVTGPAVSITVRMKDAPHVTALFTYLPTFIITPTTGPGGHILPATPQTVKYEASTGFIFQPNPGYTLVDVGVDGLSIGRTSPYSFTQVHASHTLTATFSPIHFTLTATPSTLIANGVSTALLTLSAGPLLAGQKVFLDNTGAPLQLTLDHTGSAQTTYTAGLAAGTGLFTATLPDIGITHTATFTLQLLPSPLQGTLNQEIEGHLITYTFTLTNAAAVTQTNVVLTGNVAAHTELLRASTVFSSTTGGENGQGYVTATVSTLAPDQSIQVNWTVRLLDPYQEIVTQAHGRSDTDQLRLIARHQDSYRLWLPIIVRN